MPTFRDKRSELPKIQTGGVFWGRARSMSRAIRPMRKKDERKASQRTHLILTKRRKFVLVSLVLSLGLYIIQRLPVESRYLAIFLFALASYILGAWSLLADLRGVGWLTNLTLPTMFPVSVALFYFLLPQAMWTRLIVIAIFAVSMYGLMLTANIFAVALIRTIQLLRAARTVGFLLSVLTSAFMFHVIFSLKMPFLVVVALSLLVLFPLFLQGVWSYTLGSKLTSRDMAYAVVGTVAVAEAILSVSFWLVDVALISILLAMIVYVILGIFQHSLEKRLFGRTVQEYVGFMVIVFVVVATAVVARWMS